MGAWGTQPTENDAACNWLETLFSKGLETQIRSQLDADIFEEPEEIRAAAHVASVLIRSDVWPSESRKEMKDLAKFKLQRILDEKVFTNAFLVSAIRKEIQTLACERSR